MSFGNGAGELGLFPADGSEAVNEGVAKTFDGFAFFVRENADLAGEIVPAAVEARVLLAFFGARTGGFLRIAAVGLYALRGDEVPAHIVERRGERGGGGGGGTGGGNRRHGDGFLFA